MNELRIEYLPVNSLKPYEKNTRKHKDLDVDNIAKSIEKYGFNDPVGIATDENIIVCGHGRVLACKKLGIKEVPCIRLDHLSEQERREYAIAHNATAELSEWDFDILPNELADLDLGEFDFDFGIDLDGEEIGILESVEDEAATYEQRKQEFEERMASGELSDDDEEYQEFLAKFEAKKTTDDCYTPPIVYEAVADYVAEHYGLDKKDFVRPFVPRRRLSS